MKRKVNRILGGICFVLALCFCMTLQTDKVYAQGAWYEDYDYALVPAYENDRLVTYLSLFKYEGNGTVLHIPETTTIDGVAYRTKLAEGFKFGDNKGQITNITFGTGVLLPVDCTFLFGDMEKLQSVNAEALDMSSVTSTYGMFKHCKSLIKLNV